MRLCETLDLMRVLDGLESKYISWKRPTERSCAKIKRSIARQTGADDADSVIQFSRKAEGENKGPAQDEKCTIISDKAAD